MFVDACLFDDFVWHGNAMTVREEEETTTAGERQGSASLNIASAQDS